MKTLEITYLYLQDDPDFGADCEGFRIKIDGVELTGARKLRICSNSMFTQYPKSNVEAFIAGVLAADPSVDIIETSAAELPC